MTLFLNTIDYKRECGTCSMCCQGWLTGNIYEYTMGPHNPCHFVEDNSPGGCCKIYEHRPAMCSGYQCVWLQQPIAFPEWMKPEKSKVIVTQRTVEDAVTKEEMVYWQIKECGEKIDSAVLNWIIRNVQSYKVNAQYEVGGQWYYMGSDSFMELMVGGKYKDKTE